MIKTYYELTKPGIIYGNLLVAVAAFIFGSHSSINWLTFACMAVGLACVIGSACVFNNIADRKMDAHMERTKKRGLASGTVSVTQAFIFASILLVIGVAALYFCTTMLALASALVGFVSYVFLYTPLKPRTSMAMFVGAISGATPPLVGYTAATNMLDGYALAFFAFMFLWQIPHFLAIARYRFEEYSAAGVPLLVRQPKDDAARKKARKIFRYSLILLLLFCLILILQR